MWDDGGYDERPGSDLVEVRYYAICHQTENAFLFMVEDQEEVWVPKSQVKDMDDRVFYIPQWLADKHGLD